MSNTNIEAIKKIEKQINKLEKQNIALAASVMNSSRNIIEMTQIMERVILRARALERRIVALERTNK